MRPLFFSLLLVVLLGSRPTQAQSPASGSLAPAALPAVTAPAATPAPAAAPAAGPLAPTPTDTAATLRSYFARRRHNGHVSLGVGVSVVGVGGLVLAATSQAHGEGALAYVFFAALSVAAGVPLIARGIVLMATHTPAREQRVLQAWQQHRLPRRLGRRALAPANPRL